jgi:hypothetical protein
MSGDREHSLPNEPYRASPPAPDPRLIRIIKDEPGHIEKFIMEDMFSYRTFLFIIVVQLWVIIFKLYGVY